MLRAPTIRAAADPKAIERWVLVEMIGHRPVPFSEKGLCKFMADKIERAGRSRPRG
jgi:hypothetical protein